MCTILHSSVISPNQRVTGRYLVTMAVGAAAARSKANKRRGPPESSSRDRARVEKNRQRMQVRHSRELLTRCRSLWSRGPALCYYSSITGGVACNVCHSMAWHSGRIYEPADRPRNTGG